MNEQIKKLYEQAHEQKPIMVMDPVTCEPANKIGNDGAPMYHKVLNPEKFANLIIQECADICNDVEEYMSEKLIKKHFGVK